MGDSNDFTVEQRVLNAVTFASTIIVVFTTILDCYLEGIFIEPFLVSVFVSIVFSSLYYRSRFLKISSWNATIVMVVIVFTLNYFWFELGGPNGIIPLAIVIGTAFFVSISKRKDLKYIIVLLSIDVIALHLISYFYPELIHRTYSPLAKSIEIGLFNFITVLLTALLIIYFKRNFENEKKVIEIQNSELASSEEELKQNSEELTSINDHLQDARDRAEQSSNAKADFLSTMSHEIRTPLNAIIGSSHALSLNNQISSEDIEKVGIINFASEQLLHLINDILDFSKIEAGELIIQASDFNLRLFLEQLISSFKEKAFDNKVNLALAFDDKIKRDVNFDKGRLTQILTNLMDNAIKFSNGASVCLNVGLEDSEGGKQSITFKVIDTGIGIKESDQESVFEVFKQAESSSTRSFGGTGLGLSITKKLLELLESEILLESEYGKGTTFSFSLSMDKATCVVSDDCEARLEILSSLEGKKILVVDDNQLNLKVAEMILESWGMVVTSSLSGEKAIEILENGFPDFILMDLQMPDLDGYETTGIIRRKFIEFQSIPIIALTASATRDVKEKAMKAGLDDFVTKPFIPEKLKGILLSHM